MPNVHYLREVEVEVDLGLHLAIHWRRNNELLICWVNVDSAAVSLVRPVITVIDVVTPGVHADTHSTWQELIG